MVAQPGPYGSLSREQGVEMSIFSGRSACPGQSQPGVAGLRVAGWLTETLLHQTGLARAPPAWRANGLLLSCERCRGGGRARRLAARLTGSLNEGPWL
jgi:hypothetical protein